MAAFVALETVVSLVLKAIPVAAPRRTGSRHSHRTKRNPLAIALRLPV